MARTFHNFLSPLAGGSAVEAFQPSPRLARASLNSAAPVLEDRLRSVTAELHGSARAHWWRSFAPHRVSFLPRLSVWDEEDEGEKKGSGF